MDSEVTSARVEDVTTQNTWESPAQEGAKPAQLAREPQDGGRQKAERGTERMRLYKGLYTNQFSLHTHYCQYIKA